MITSTDALSDLCARLAKGPYITLDTEFMRETTYWPRLCLIQLAGPEEACVIDPLADGISIEPLDRLLADTSTVKVFHAARQDIEIFYNRTGTVPTPIFDTQVAAMVCGFGESVAYETLARKLAKAQIDKSSRFTDWSRRPLTDRQLKYAIGDVTHLREVYEKLASRLERTGRSSWLAGEMKVLTATETYALDPKHAWRRIKTRTTKPQFLAVLREIAAWREREARNRDVPRNRVVRDEALLEISAEPPSDSKRLAHVRGLNRGFAEGRLGQALLQAIALGIATPPELCPVVTKPEPLPSGLGPLIDLLKVLLKMKSEAHHVAQRLVCNSADLERIAADDTADVPALMGWRREIFGEDALALKHGRIALAAQGRKVSLVPIPDPAAAD